MSGEEGTERDRRAGPRNGAGQALGQPAALEKKTTKTANSELPEPRTSPHYRSRTPGTWNRGDPSPALPPQERITSPLPSPRPALPGGHTVTHQPTDTPHSQPGTCPPALVIKRPLPCTHPSFLHQLSLNPLGPLTAPLPASASFVRRQRCTVGGGAYAYTLQLHGAASAKARGGLSGQQL